VADPFFLAACHESPACVAALIAACEAASVAVADAVATGLLTAVARRPSATAAARSTPTAERRPRGEQFDIMVKPHGETGYLAVENDTQMYLSAQFVDTRDGRTVLVSHVTSVVDPEMIGPQAGVLLLGRREGLRGEEHETEELQSRRLHARRAASPGAVRRCRLSLAAHLCRADHPASGQRRSGHQVDSGVMCRSCATTSSTSVSPWRRPRRPAMSPQPADSPQRHRRRHHRRRQHPTAIALHYAATAGRGRRAQAGQDRGGRASARGRLGGGAAAERRHDQRRHRVGLCIVDILSTPGQVEFDVSGTWRSPTWTPRAGPAGRFDREDQRLVVWGRASHRSRRAPGPSTIGSPTRVRFVDTGEAVPHRSTWTRPCSTSKATGAGKRPTCL